MIISSYEGTDGQQISDVLRQAVDAAQKHIEKLERAQANGARKRMSVKSANVIGNRKSNPESYKRHSGYDYPKYDELARRARAHVDELKAEADRIHEENREALENNIAIREAIEAMMKQIGIGDTYTVSAYKSKRSTKKTETRHRAGYKEDIDRWLPCSDGYEYVESAYKQAMADIGKWEENKRNEEQKKEHEAAKEAEAQEAVMKKAVLIAKYKLPHTADASDILMHILDQNRYLKLAHYLHQNRCDWSDGYDQARRGIDGFEPATDADKLMISTLRELLEDLEERGEVDGRYFRDCDYNYTEIFAMVDDTELFADFEVAREMAGLLT